MTGLIVSRESGKIKNEEVTKTAAVIYKGLVAKNNLKNLIHNGFMIPVKPIAMNYYSN